MLNKYGAKEVCDVTFFAIGGANAGKPEIFLDTLKTSGVETKAGESSAKGGKGNSKLLTWSHSKEANMKMQDALVSMKTLAMLNGTGVVTGATNIFKTETMVLGTTKASLAETPIADTVVALDEEGNTIDVTVTGKEISLKAPVQKGEGAQAPASTVKARVFYQFAKATGAEKIVVSANKFAGYYKVVGDTVLRNADSGQDEAFQIVIHKAKMKSDINLEFKADGEPSVFNLDLEVFPNENGDMVEYIKY
ncbi:hypothetical protein [Bacillus cereus]|uniref:Uncharacterized protein n=1 Tax=Bacillus cereus HuA3-9 TaxID=1053205 RepID=R8CIQ6_BACCE|nr:hypothetical protein [Bacillus cereus]EOO11477.1 hypothetical protein IGA_05753 [Bacillus cereus HuA3-9]